MSSTVKYARKVLRVESGRVCLGKARLQLGGYEAEIVGCGVKGGQE
jgi:hypothetical protein